MDVFELLEQLDAQTLVLVLQQAGARDAIPARAARHELFITAREWAVNPARIEALRQAAAKYLDTGSGGTGALPSQVRPPLPPPAPTATDQDAILRAALVRMDLLDRSAATPTPYLRASGMAGKSSVWLFVLPTGKHLVAKFDRPDRAAAEWRAISALRRLNTPPAAILPLGQNLPSDGVVVYQGAHGLAGSGTIIDFTHLLEKQLFTNGANCLTALDQTFAALEMFYRGKVTGVTGGQVLTWQAMFPALASSKRLDLAALVPADWRAAFHVRTGLPEPFAALDQTLSSLAGQMMVSQIHGDLNLSNVLFGLDGQAAPKETFIIDLACWQPQAATAFDPAIMESQFWHDSWPRLCPHEDEAMAVLLAVGQHFNGELVIAPAGPRHAAALAFIARLREHALSILRDRPNYCLRDYMTALYLQFVRALPFATVQRSPLAVQLTYAGACLARRFLDRLESGVFTNSPPPPMGARPDGDAPPPPARPPQGAAGLPPPATPTSQPTASPHHAAAPQSHFVIFCRICGIGDMAADELGAAQQALATVCDRYGQQPGVFAIHSSVYGRFLCVDGYRAAGETAIGVMDAAAAAGVCITVGMDEGRTEVVHDLNRDNRIGRPINVAARLAVIAEQQQLFIIATPRVRDALAGAVSQFRKLFGARQQAPGKRDEVFAFHPLQHERPPVAALAPAADGPQKVHVLVYDIVGFSAMAPDRAWDVLTHLRRTVLEIDQATKGRTWYAPAGDGGVLVYDNVAGGGAPLLVAEHLADACRGQQEIRIGLASGPAVIIADDLPVGTAILRADQLSSLPPTGHIGVDRTYWYDRSETDQHRWQVEAHQGDPHHPRDADALLISRAGHAGSPPANAAAAGPRLATDAPAAPPDRAALRAVLDALPRSKIGVVGSVLAAGLAPGMDKDTAIACLLDWATTPESLQALRRTIGVQP